MSGFTSTEVIEHLDQTSVTDACGVEHRGVRTQLSEKKYDMVFLMIGTNDLGIGGDRSIDELTRNIHSLREICLQFCPKITIFTIPSSTGRGVVQDMNERIRKLVANNPTDTYLFDCFVVFFQNPLNQYENCGVFDNDGLHFSSYGSEKLGGKIFEQLRDLGIEI